MDPLKTYIDKHRAAFDEEAPRAGHFERLRQRQQVPAKRRRAFRLQWAAAASVLLFLSAGLWWLSRPEPVTGPVTVLCEDSGNMKACYLRQMEATAEAIDKLSEKLEPFVRDEVQTEVSDILDNNRAFDRDLPEELSDKEAKEILSDYYRYNLEVLQRIARQIAMNN